MEAFISGDIPADSNPLETTVMVWVERSVGSEFAATIAKIPATNMTVA